MKNIFIRFLELVFSPIIDKNGFLKFPKNKKGKLVVIFLFMFAVMLTAIIYNETVNNLWNLPLWVEK